MHEKKVKLKLFSDKNNAAKEYNESQKSDVNNGINEFEKNLIRLGIDHSGESEKKIVKQDLAIEAAVTMAKIKENKKKNIEAAKEREIRQRNSYIEQQKNEKFQAYKEGSLRIGTLLINIFSNQIKSGLNSLAVYQKKLKKIDEVQRKILEYKAISEEKWGNLSKKFREELDLLETIAKKENSLRRKKITDSMIEDMIISHKNHETLCKPIVKDIFIIAEQAYDYIVTNNKIPGSL